jgi:hypothetical protein
LFTRAPPEKVTQGVPLISSTHRWKSCFRQVLRAIVQAMHQAMLLSVLLTAALLALAGLLLRPAR